MINPVLTLNSLLRVSFRKPNLFSFMPCQRTANFKNSSSRRKKQLDSVSFEKLIMRFCHNCARLSKQCRVNNNFDICLKCVRLDRDCDLFFSAVKWRWVRKKSDRFFRELKKTSEQIKIVNAKTARLQKQFEFVNKKKKTMLNQEFENIIELEEKKQQRAIESSIDDLLFDVLFERFEILSEFDWLNFFVESVAEAFHSSWNSSSIFKYFWYVYNLFTWSDIEIDLEFLVDLRYLLLHIRRSDSLN